MNEELKKASEVINRFFLERKHRNRKTKFVADERDLYISAIVDYLDLLPNKQTKKCQKN